MPLHVSAAAFPKIKKCEGSKVKVSITLLYTSPLVVYYSQTLVGMALK